MSLLLVNRGVLKTFSQVDQNELMRIKRNGSIILEIRRTAPTGRNMFDKQQLSSNESKCILKKKEELIKLVIRIRTFMKNIQLPIHEKLMSTYQINSDPRSNRSLLIKIRCFIKWISHENQKFWWKIFQIMRLLLSKKHQKSPLFQVIITVNRLKNDSYQRMKVIIH